MIFIQANIEVKTYILVDLNVKDISFVSEVMLK